MSKINEKTGIYEVEDDRILKKWMNPKEQPFHVSEMSPLIVNTFDEIYNLMGILLSDPRDLNSGIVYEPEAIKNFFNNVLRYKDENYKRLTNTDTIGLVW